MNSAFIAHFRDQYLSRGIILDSFQEEAILALVENHDVLVSAPTGAGKTIIAEFAIELALAKETRCIYTAPIKALSNQIYRELATRYDPQLLGLLTGDLSLNSNAQILVVTTEVLRNMLFAQDQILADIGYVVLDEVHYLSDKSRGPVWEELILQLPSQIRLVSLSATIANIAQFTAWLRSVRGNTKCIVSKNRPVPLEQALFSKGELIPLFQDEYMSNNANAPSKRIASPALKHEEQVEKSEQIFSSEFNTQALMQAIAVEQRVKTTTGCKTVCGNKQISPVVRKKIALALQKRKLLPAIEFIFSRKGCDRAVKDLLDAKVCFTTNLQQNLIRQKVQELSRKLSAQERQALHFHLWEKALLCGFAAHHAGMFPALKELIEELTNAGLLFLIYATGTLSLGINMPVRSVVLEELYKWNGTGFENLSGIEYTQLIGRAGRRGKDTKGSALILARPNTDIKQLQILSSGELEQLNSVFSPSYNTVVNLVGNYGYAKARLIMGASFAQYQRNAELGRIQGKITRILAKIESLRPEILNLCEKGDFAAYLEQRVAVKRAKKAARKKAQMDWRRETRASWDNLKNGTVYALAIGAELTYGLVLSHDSKRARIINLFGELLWIRALDLSAPAREITQISLPHGISPKQGRAREIISANIFEQVSERIELGQDLDLTDSKTRFASAQIPELLLHEVHQCPDLTAHLHAAEDYTALLMRRNSLQIQADRTDDSVAQAFDAAAQVLGQIGIFQGVPDLRKSHAISSFAQNNQQKQKDAAVSYSTENIRLSLNADLLRGIHNENDLLIFLCLHEPILRSLTPAHFAGICAAFLGDKRIGKMPILDLQLRNAWKRVEANYSYLHSLESEYGIELTAEPNASGVQLFAAWAEGASLGKILKNGGVEVGDFINCARRLLDLLQQLLRVGADTWIAQSAQEAIKLVRRWDWI